MSGQPLTSMQILKDFCADYDLPKVYLRAHEVLIRCGVSEDGRAVVLIRRYRTAETRKQLRYVARGKLARSWVWADDEWTEQPSFMVWEDNFQPEIVAHFNGHTFLEQREYDNWAKDCYRPGGGRFPLDNFDRTFDASCYSGIATKPMLKHWGVSENG